MIICKLEMHNWDAYDPNKQWSEISYTLSDDRHVTIVKHCPIQLVCSGDKFLSKKEYAYVIWILNFQLIIDEIRIFLCRLLHIRYDSMHDYIGFSLYAYDPKGKVKHSITGYSMDFKTFEMIIPILCR